MLAGFRLAHQQPLAAGPGRVQEGFYSMQGLVYHLSLPKVLLARLLAGRRPEFVTGPWSALQLTEMASPALRGPDWAVVAPRLAGICGTDTGVVTGQSSPAASPFNSFPAVFGHEVVGVLQAVGADIPHPPGTRVVIDPAITCTMRKIEPPCSACQAGQPYLCRHCTTGALAPGMITGFCRDLPGGWAELMAVHKDQLHVVPDGLTDERAVLVEPLAVAAHGVLRQPPPPGAAVLVIGGGTIGLSTVAALRLLGYDCRITLAARHAFQADLGRRLGADSVIDGRGDSVLAAAANLPEASRHRPIMGRPVLRGGFDLVYDCAGTRSSLDDALRATREGGALILLGGAGELKSLDMTFVWLRELSVIGSVGYGREQVNGRRIHTFELVLELLAARPDLPVEDLVTHRFPLAAYRQALVTALRRRDSQSIKVVFEHPPPAMDGIYHRQTADTADPTW